MPNPNAVVSTVRRVDRTERDVLVELEDGRRARLDAADPRTPALAGLLDSLGTQRLPVYLELAPETAVIGRVLIPRVTRVARLHQLDDGALGVELDLSHARHVVRRTASDFAALEAALREALRTSDLVVLTETDAHEIIDVRPYVPAPDAPAPPGPRPPPDRPVRGPWLWRWVRELIDRIWIWRWWPWWWRRCISSTRAQQAFDAMAATSCAPLTVPAPCIPFLYPDDGCWARAHEMCRLLLGMGLSPRKVWIQGSLHTPTRNNPQCFVNWGWHVAPTLCVRGPRFFQRRTMVVDPSLFTTPVTEAAWKGVQGDPGASLTDTDASIYWLWNNGTYPGYVDTNVQLAFYRLQLQNRAINVGPPPYANCP